ncbi:MAG: T9SS type A sorting domain-containing protein [Ignavibacteria bacterium]|nr:T9SS type A sorting domain-containing protein [Ignavibacteria bacterium]
MTAFLFAVLLCSLITNVHGTIRYVKAGNPTPQPPYTSWATASDSIQKCVNVCQRGDTIYVGSGVYREYLRNIPPFLTIVGEEMESTVINCSGLKSTNSFRKSAVELADSLTVLNLTLIGNSTEINDSLIKIAFEDNPLSGIASGILVRYCKLINFLSGVSLARGVIGNTIMRDVHTFLLTSIDANNIDSIKLCDNVLVHPLYSMENFIINYLKYPNILITNNIFIKPFQSSSFYSQLYSNIFSINPIVEFSNNLFYTRSYNNDINTFVPANGTMSFFNNVFCISEGPAREYRKDFMVSSGNVTFTNNVVYGFDKGIWNNSPNLKVNNNCFWNVPTPISGTQPPLVNSGNLYVNPMFVKDYGDFPDIDFHLQMYSPLIDAGDSTILDKDGTRSDIGFYGGPFGESYTYQDYAPRVPARVKLRSTGTQGIYELSWRPNTESDLNRYEVYADSTRGFTPDTTKIIWNGTDTLFNFVHKKPYNKPVFFKVKAVDNQNLKSDASEETGIVPVSVDEGDIISEDYHLYQNYPNPFNPSTTIEYKLKTRSRVRLDIYNSSGELVKTMINKEQEGGYYSLTVNAEDLAAPGSKSGGVASGVYIYRINVVESERDIPVYIQSRKMLFVK